MTYTPTIYEQIVRDFLSLSLKDYSYYEKKWAKRGYNKKDFVEYIKDIEYAHDLTLSKDFNVVKASNQAKEYVKDRNKYL